ncbi:hypothetical protein F4780DRAFT_776746 [Xylariomycetidae sp. FL0641]|nr:hypothetical protein F4780DRAFT_776746 [Xylariomycetidae sp. FL0641]
MTLKQSTIALSSCSNLTRCFSPAQTCITSSCRSRSSQQRDHHYGHEPTCLASSTRATQTSDPRNEWLRYRSYATVSDSSPRGHRQPPSSDRSTHDTWPSTAHPTPYEIFGQQKHAPYTKDKFYQLVKAYHPDRHHVAPGRLSHSVRLDRYRLVVAANDILSDPTKRRAYDLYGAGWGDKLSMCNRHRSGYKSWREEPGNPSMNATWEDWERWYGERNGQKEKQAPLYMSNELFVAILCMFVVIGSMGQARRANASSMNIMDMRDEKHAAVSKNLRQIQAETAPLNRHERIENFLRQRESWRVPVARSEADSPTPEKE